MEKLIITPKTKIYDLLEHYPQLEDLLIGEAPQFKRLTNPVLRKTITKITSLSQAATIAGLNVEVLVNTLRCEVGQDDIENMPEGSRINFIQPEWFAEDKVSQDLDVREMLHRGEHPVHEVLAAVRELDEGMILRMIAPFNPVPLIEKSLSLGHQHWVNKISEEEYHIFFIR